MTLLQWLAAAGIGGVIGSLITSIVQAWSSQRTQLAARNFQEKKEAYVGFLESLHRSDVEQTRETSMATGHWFNRCELVASKEVRDAAKRIFETNPSPGGDGHPDRPAVIEELRRAMRRDLGVDKV